MIGLLDVREKKEFMSEVTLNLLQSIVFALKTIIHIYTYEAQDVNRSTLDTIKLKSEII